MINLIKNKKYSFYISTHTFYKKGISGLKLYILPSLSYLYMGKEKANLHPYYTITCHTFTFYILIFELYCRLTCYDKICQDNYKTIAMPKKTWNWSVNMWEEKIVLFGVIKIFKYTLVKPYPNGGQLNIKYTLKRCV